MSEKRPAESSEQPPRPKRSRFGPVNDKATVPATPAGTTTLPANGINGAKAPSSLPNAKALELLAKKDALKAQIQALKDRKLLSASGASTSAPTSGSLGMAAPPKPQAASRPAPLRVDDQGREIDEQGRVIERPKQAVTTLRVNQRPAEIGKEKEKEGSREKVVRPEDFFDPNLTDKSFNRLNRRQKVGFDFVKAGSFQKEAEQRRLKAAFGDQAAQEQKERREKERRSASEAVQGDPNLVPLGKRVPTAKVEAPKEPIPEVEWWDAGLLQNGASFEEDDVGEVRINESKLTIYVEHPVPLEPPAEEAQPPPMPLPLTQKERKKLRTQRRLEAEKEKQELIRQGLLEPPKPKLKLSTFSRSMGVEAAADPTMVEQQVRADQEARQQAHEDRNLASKLTPAERREKKIKKLTGAASEGEAKPVSVYRVNCSTTPQQRFKIRANAEELHMTGCAVVTETVTVIVVEGGAKAQKKYAHVVQNRIKWAPDDEEDTAEDRPPKECTKAWSGSVKAAAFEKFVTEVCRTEAAAKKFFADNGIGHYWDLAVADAVLS